MDHKYKGQWIVPCESAEHRAGDGSRYRWIIQGYHETGMPLSDAQCSHYFTLAQAKEAILAR